MLRLLFGRLTREPRRGQALFDSTVAEARRSHWYLAGEIPDTLEGRFAVLATVCAMTIVRLESGSSTGAAGSAALTERFVEAMDAEHRELGLNDPGLGRRVRKLVASLERRVDEWRDAVAGERQWSDAVVSSLYRGTEPTDAALAHSSAALRSLWGQLSSAADGRIVAGEIA